MLKNLFVSETRGNIFSNLRLKVASQNPDQKLQNFFVSGVGVTGYAHRDVQNFTLVMILWYK